jgi:hypothetical protein
MGTRLSPPDEELYQRVDEILHYIWDPIGVSEMPEARDEYFSFLPGVFNLLEEKVDAEVIAQHFQNVATDAMGLSRTISQARKVVGILLDWQAVIEKKYK